MKQTSLLGILLVLVLAGCVKPKDLTPLGSTGIAVSTSDPTQKFDSTGQKLRASGTFQNGVHTVSGKVNLYERNGKQTLVFDGFQSDTGPDLRIYLATNTQATDFVEVSMLTATGNFFVEVPAGVSMSQESYVLIWCKRFSVHFGNAELKAK